MNTIESQINLQQIFLDLVSKYKDFPGTAQKLWREIESAYTSKNRHYHNLTHLKNLIEELLPFKENQDEPQVLKQFNKHTINDWDAVMFAVFYHDIIYNTEKQNSSEREKIIPDPVSQVTIIGEQPLVSKEKIGDNEQKSAMLADERLTRINVPQNTKIYCISHILATSSRLMSSCADSNIFTDADLSVLGKDSMTYLEYAKNIRKEYSQYSDADYKAGRNKVLNHFLEMRMIFKTIPFYSAYEENARKNILAELNLIKENFDENEFKENILKMENEKIQAEQARIDRIERDRIQSETNKNKNDDEWVDMYNLDD